MTCFVMGRHLGTKGNLGCKDRDTGGAREAMAPQKFSVVAAVYLLLLYYLSISEHQIISISEHQSLCSYSYFFMSHSLCYLPLVQEVLFRVLYKTNLSYTRRMRL